MNKAWEDVCCHDYDVMKKKMDRLGKKCITETHGFEDNCLNHGVLEASVFEFVQRIGGLGDNDPINM